MRRLCIIAGLCITASVLYAQNNTSGIMYVAIKTVELKKTAGIFAAGQGVLVYGDAVAILEIKGQWAHVRAAKDAKLSGWTAVANLSKKRVISGNQSAVTASEVALSGKGFNQEIENIYKAQGRLNYAGVDRIEALQIPMEYVQRFIIIGHLYQGGEE